MRKKCSFQWKKCSFQRNGPANGTNRPACCCGEKTLKASTLQSDPTEQDHQSSPALTLSVEVGTVLSTMMEDSELSPAPSNHNSPCPSPSISISSTSPSLSLPSTPSSSCSAQQDATLPLHLISEGLAERSSVIDAEVAHRACQEVLQKVRLKQEEGDVTVVENGPDTEPQTTTGATVKPLKLGEEVDAESQTPSSVKSARRRQRQNPSKQSWLLRLFESKMFDVSMAISYLHKSKEPGVQAYIGNRLFSFSHEDVDFYLPQLLNMYIHMDEDVGDAIKPYVVHRCRQSIAFSLQCAWLLGAYSSDMHISTQRHSRGTKLRKLILSDELKPAGSRARRDPLALALAHFCPVTSEAGPLGAEHGLSPSKRTHQRSKSDATVSISLSTNLKRTASNPKVESSPDENKGPQKVFLDMNSVHGSIEVAVHRKPSHTVLPLDIRTPHSSQAFSCQSSLQPEQHQNRH
ncbi:Phosphatidylinositol 4-kinase beta [Takifugu flavidus]|uniref:Phosphatidylinositol 4-kinase beta n=1 Tax=Takifugu flavidus TaxID=433684 RepID=A0A5C6PKI9_9TELE|nr:Phosphatidylinositol 4-kinase beta [Takifugu flavidus]